MKRVYNPYIFLVCIFVWLIVSPSISWAKIIFVKPSGVDSNDGLSWTKAKKTIQSAINISTAKDEIWVTSGTYYERIVLKNDIRLFGGFLGNESTLNQRDFRVNISIIDGSKSGSVITIPPGAEISTAIDGFTVRNGTGEHQGDQLYGGGIYALDASATISNNTIKGNTAETGGGLWSNKSIILKDNLFQENEAIIGGGALLIFGNNSVENNTFKLNKAADGGGGLNIPYSSGLISNNLFESNNAKVGGGLSCKGSHGIIKRNTFKNNTGYFGAAIANNGSTGITTSNWMENNVALIDGGAILCYANTTESIFNNVIINNSAQIGGGLATKYSNPKIFNNTFVGNQASSVGGGVAFLEQGTGILINNIISFGSSGIYVDNGLNITMSNNNLFGNTSGNYSGVGPGAQDVTLDPIFTDRTQKNFELTANSPCIDTGTDSGDVPTEDYKGAIRPQDGDGSGIANTDIGAFELPGRAQIKLEAPRNLRIIDQSS